MSWMRQRIGLLALFFLPVETGAERLPCETFSIADGLPHNHVTSIAQDSRGFIWFGTAEGLARFDGARFKTYDTRDGLPSRAVSLVHETRDRMLWVGTPSGLCLLHPRPVKGKVFECAAPEDEPKSRQVNTLFEDSGGNLWLGTNGGPYRVSRTVSREGAVRFAFEAVDMGISQEEPDRSIRSFAEHPNGVLWAGGGGGIYKRSRDGTVVRFTTREGLPENVVTRVMRDRDGRIWAGFWERGLALLVNDPEPGKPAVERVLRFRYPGVGDGVSGIYQTLDGRILVNMANSLIEVTLDPQRLALRSKRYTKAHGLGSNLTTGVTEDREGNLWMESSDAGAMRIPPHGFVAYGPNDGISNPDTSALIEVPGEGLVIGRQDVFHRFDGSRFIPVVPNLPREMLRDPILLGWGWNQSILRDHEGDWWIPTERGIFRFAKPRHLADLARARLKANYTMRDGLSANGIFRLFEDSRGDVWVSVMAEGVQLFRWDRRQDKFFPQSVRRDAPDQKTEAPTAFVEDRDGTIWVGFYVGGMGRYRDGQWDFFTPTSGAPSGFVDDLHVDRAGRLWIAYNGGLKRIDDTRASIPQFVTYTRDHGLPSNSITSLAEDRYGRIYLGMNSRITRLDPRFPREAARLKHYTAADGVPNGNSRVMLVDREGAIWTAGVNGVARLIPEPPESEPPAPVRIVGLKAGGASQRLSEFGETHAKGFSFPDKGGSIEIEFASLSYVPGLGHSYSYRLEEGGAGWSRPSPVNRVVFAALAPGSYKFMVKAVSHDSDAESEPAILDFTIAAPLYRRAWFLTLLGLLAAFSGIMLYRTRWKRLLALERIRMQIATDLHDELGAGLSKVAMMSEVALLSHKEEERATALTRLAEIARELLDSAGDLVWAIRPRKDQISDLSQRMREFATEALSLRNIRVEFDVAPAALNLKLDPEQRRQVFAVFKESINNVVRHSGCTRVCVELGCQDGTLVLATSDDGKGLAPDGDPETIGHHGIVGMRWRAQMLGGALDLDSPSGNGLRVILRVPLAAKGRRRTPA